VKWTVFAAQLALLASLSTAIVACGKGESNMIFSVNQQAHVESLVPTLPASVVELWRDELPASTPESVIEARPERCPELACKVAETWLKEQGGQRVLVEADYALSPAAEALMSLLSELHLHALPRDRFQVDAIEAHWEHLQKRWDDADWAAQIQIEEPLVVAAGLHFREQSRREPADPEGVARWFALSDHVELQRLREDFRHANDALEKEANALEWLLTVAWLEYVDIMHGSNIHYWDKDTLFEVGLIVVDPDHVVSEDEEEVVTMPKTTTASRAGVADEEVQRMTDLLRVRRMKEELQQLTTSTLKERAAALEPPFEHYAALKAAFADYLELAEAGGWVTDLAIEREIRPGQRHAEMPRLRERLRAEGFEIESSDSTVFDAKLVAAIKDYQFTHQLDENGRLTAPTVNSLNRSVETRLGEIAVAMQGWRLNPIGRDHNGYRIEINVPDFHAEVWDGEELLTRFRVVVGRFSREGATVTTKTPLFSDMLSRIVLNPYWNVPQSIVIHELLPKEAEEPGYLESQNYEVRERGSRTFIRQRPGPGNALGRVKFLFPNEYAVYMHDTPSKSLFGRSIRAFSHGCIRVQEPMDLAELLISRDRGWTIRETKTFINRAFRRNDGESYVNLEHEVPVHLYYVGVNVVEGRPHFLADIYRELGESIVENEAYVAEWLASRR